MSWAFRACALLLVAAPSIPGGVIYMKTPTGFTAAMVEIVMDGEVVCTAEKGCLMKEDPGGGMLPRIAPITYDFAVSDDEKTAITKNARTFGRLTVVASRDIGLRPKAGGGFNDPQDWIVVGKSAIPSTIGDEKKGLGFGLLYLNTKSDCGPENEKGFKEGCGPNYHTDVKATDSVKIEAGEFQKLIGGGKITLVLSPSGGKGFTGVGLLKIFDAKLEAVEVPEPAAVIPVMAGLIVFVLRRRYDA